MDRTPKNWSGQMAEELAFLSRARTWDAFFAEARVAEFRRRLYLDAFGGEYPEEAATDGYITRSELRQMAEALRVRPGDPIVDLGCGRGGPGQWIAQSTAASLLGIDFSEVAIARALARSQQAGLAQRVS